MKENFAASEDALVRHLQLDARPVAITFSDEPIDAAEPAAPAQPSGCSYWKHAADGTACNTRPEHHYNCAIGSHTHKISLPKDRQQELPETLELMVEHRYLSMDEVPGIPQLAESPASIRYVPLGESDAKPDVVLVRGSSRAIMLLQEAALRAGVEINNRLMARPTCMALPAAMQGGVTTSLGCVGNRLYTDLDDGQMYVALPGCALQAITDALPVIANANQALGAWHAQRRERLGS